MTKTKIEWTDFTWNPVWGCKNNCPFCYARKINQRFKKIKDWDNPEFIENNFNKPFPKKPSRIFINSMSDVAYWKPEWIIKTFDKIKQYPEHTFIMLTKTAELRTLEEIYGGFFPDNLYYGNTITNQSDLKKWHSTNSFECASYFLSIEPILEKIDLSHMNKIHYDFMKYKPFWIIVGVETGNRKGKIIPPLEWIVDIMNYCHFENIALFMKDSLRPIWGDNLLQEFPYENI